MVRRAGMRRWVRWGVMWALTVVSVAFAIFCPLTRWLRCQWVEPPLNPRLVIATTGDTVIVNLFHLPVRSLDRGLQFWWKTEPVDWHFWFRAGPAGDRYQVLIPVWVLAVVPGIGALILWRVGMPERRRRLGFCITCGYDRRGLAVGAPCPECGARAAL